MKPSLRDRLLALCACGCGFDTAILPNCGFQVIAKRNPACYALRINLKKNEQAYRQMGTGFRGTFVISWSQTETDGLRAAAVDILAVGATWRWTGEAVRVDGAQGMLVLEGAEGAADIRKRAARMVRRLVGAAICKGEHELASGEMGGTDNDSPEQGFIVTDGHQSFAVTLIDVPDTGARLGMFVDELPPANVDLWVVRLSVDRTAQASGARAAGGVICFTPGTVIRTAEGGGPDRGSAPR